MKKTITQEEFLNSIKNDTLEDLTFILDLSSTNNNKIKMLSKKTDTVITFDNQAAIIKLNDVYNELSKNKLNIRVEDLKDYLIKVDFFTKNYFKDFGFKNENSIKSYNYFIETDLKIQSKKLAEKKKKGTYQEIIDFTKYPAIGVLLNNIFNPNSDENKLYTQQGEHIEGLEFICNWLNFVLTSKSNSSLCPVIISEEHGVGKGRFTIMLQDFFGKYSVRVDDEALKSEFNGILQNKALTIYDEAKASDKTNNILKGLIGNKTYNARSMFSDRREENNCNNFIITGNKSEKDVVYIEPDDRRFVPFLSKNMKLEQAIYKELFISYEEFDKQLEKEKLEFFSDILCIECDYSKSGHRQVFNKFKKQLIQKNFGKTSNLIEAIKNLDLIVIEEELFEYKSSQDYSKLIKEINSGYLTKSSINFIINAYDNDSFKKDLKRLGLKFWDDAFGKSQKITANNTSFMARKLNNFNLSKVDIKKKSLTDLSGFEE